MSNSTIPTIDELHEYINRYNDTYFNISWTYTIEEIEM